MAAITVYMRPTCPYCMAARELLESKGADFTEIDITGRSDLRAEMIQRAHGGMTVPQIFAGERHLGGCDDIYALDARGELDPALAA